MVAIAAPLTPIAGKPNKPNIRTVLRTPFTTNPKKLANIGSTVFSTLLKAAA